MPKKFTNVIDRGRVTANKYNLTNNGDGTAIITDIESNINVPGTPLNKELFNPMQEGLIFTVETVHTIENSTDVYELEIDGLQGTSNLNGMPLFKGLSFNIKISETNTTNVVKIKISGNKYDLAKESGDTVVNLTVGELKRNRYYKVIFDSVRFTIPVEIIEYNPMFGANFGGLLGTPGTKKVGVAYYDVANNQTVVPTVENSLTYFESSKFIPISDYQTAKKLENLFTFGNGWVKFSFGLIIQWGESVIQNGDAIVNLPTSFKNRNYQIITSDTGGGAHRTGAAPLDEAKFKAYGRDSSGELRTTGVRWQAIGF